MKTKTLCVHADAGPDPLTGAVMTPVYLTSTYAQRIPGEHKGYEYSRTQNPTRKSLETALANLEGGRFACAFASGLAAENSILSLLSPGDRVVGGLDLYGGTFRLMKRVWERYGIRFDFVDTTKPELVEQALSDETALLWLETPSNPLIKITDIRKLRSLLNKKSPRAVLVVDNTFATPVLQRPLSLGADLVLHSTTKYIGGHSDVIGGAVITNRPDLDEKIRFHQNAAGGVPGPMDCFLLLRGIKTLSLRMQAHMQGAQAVAAYLSRHKKVSRVYYPGKNSWGKGKQMRGPGGMVAFEIKGSPKGAMRFFSRLKIFTVGESLGGVESLACYPWSMTHASIPEKARVAAGITAQLIRLSVGIEDPQDLIGDLKQALS